jgi:hypothetical protein
MGQPVERCDDCPRLYDTEGPRCDECPPLPSPQSVEDKKAGSQRAADVNEIMKIVMKTAAKIAVERPDLQINSNLPLLRETHPEWFDSESDKTNTE